MSEGQKPSRKRLAENRCGRDDEGREGDVAPVELKEMPKAPPEVLAKMKMFKLNRRNAITSDSLSAPNPFAAIKVAPVCPKPAATGFGSVLAPSVPAPSPSPSPFPFSFSSKTTEVAATTTAETSSPSPAAATNGGSSTNVIPATRGPNVSQKFSFNFGFSKPATTESPSSQGQENKDQQTAVKFGSFGFPSNKVDEKDKNGSALGEFKFNFTAASANIGNTFFHSSLTPTSVGSNGNAKKDGDGNNNNNSSNNDIQDEAKAFAESPSSKSNALSSAPIITEPKAGDEEDEILMTLRNCKVYRVGDDKAWHERGQGDVKVLMHKGNKPLIVMYSSATFLLLLQILIDKTFSIGKVTEKSVTLRTVEDESGSIKPRLYLIKILDEGKEESIHAFVDKLKELIPK